MTMLPEGDSAFVTSCAFSDSHHIPGGYLPPGGGSNVPNATDIATVFLRSQYPMKFESNATYQAQETKKLSDGTFLTYLLLNGSKVCNTPVLLNITNIEKHNDIELWWTITELVTVDFYNRLPIYLPPGRTHLILVNTTRFPDSNMIIAETTINNNNHAADIAEIFMAKNGVATPYSHMHDVLTSNTTLMWKGDAVTQYVVVVPPDVYFANSTSHDDFAPDANETVHWEKEREMLPLNEHSLDQLEQFAIQMWPQLKEFNGPKPENALHSQYSESEESQSILPPFPHGSRPYFSIWIENTSNFTLNYTIRVTQATEQHLNLTARSTRYSSPYLYTAFFNFTKQDIIDAMKESQTEDDSADLFNLVIDLTTHQETFLSKHPVIILGMDFYPTGIHYTAMERTLVTDEPNKPLLAVFMRLHHQFNLSSIPNDAVFHLRLDGVSYSPEGYQLEAMIIRTKPIPSLPFSTNFTDITQEWVLFSYDPKLGFHSKNHKNVKIRTDLTREGENFGGEEEGGIFEWLVGTRKRSSTSETFTRAFFSIDSGMNRNIQAYSSTGRQDFPNEMQHEYKFDRGEKENQFYLCRPMNMSQAHTFTLWNPLVTRKPIDLFVSFRTVDACLAALTPGRPIPKYAIVILIAIGSVLALLLVIFSLYLCARPTKTEFLTASEEEADRIRTMSRSHKEVAYAEAADYDKIPYFVRDSITPHTLSTQYSLDRDGEDESDFDESDGLVARRTASSTGSRLAAAVFGSQPLNSLPDHESDLENAVYY